MTGLADADLVKAVVKTSDHLKDRAMRQRRLHDLVVPFSVGIELLFVARKHGVPCVDFIGATSIHFEVDRVEVLLAAAEALDDGEIGTVFDAVHASQALLDGFSLHTTDKRLLDSSFPTTAF